MASNLLLIADNNGLETETPIEIDGCYAVGVRNGHKLDDLQRTTMIELATQTGEADAVAGNKPAASMPKSIVAQAMREEK